MVLINLSNTGLLLQMHPQTIRRRGEALGLTVHWTPGKQRRYSLDEVLKLQKILKKLKKPTIGSSASPNSI